MQAPDDHPGVLRRVASREGGWGRSFDAGHGVLPACAELTFMLFGVRVCDRDALPQRHLVVARSVRGVLLGGFCRWRRRGAFRSRGYRRNLPDSLRVGESGSGGPLLPAVPASVVATR